MQNSNNLLIIHPEGNIKNNPNLFYFTKELVKNGFNVFILSRLRPGIFQGELFEGAEFRYFTSDKSENLNVKKQILKLNFCHIIGIDEGIIEAERFSKVLKIPYSFLSYEIFFDNELEKLANPTDLKIKKKSREACKNICFAIIQDEVRREILSKEYAIDIQKILLMPVAGSGIREIPKTKYFHNRLNIPAANRVLLYMGWMDEIQMNRLLGYVKYMPQNWVLVVHSRYKYSGSIPVDFPANKIYFSLDEPVESIDDIGQLLSGCDAGFCSYQASYDSPFTGDNITYIGLSSGKTTTFLQYGIPVVVENMNLWDEIVENEKLGIVLKHQRDLNQLDLMLNNKVMQKCFHYFDAKLDLKNYFYPIVHEISKNIPKQNKISVVEYTYFILEEYVSILKWKIKKLKN